MAAKNIREPDAFALDAFNRDGLHIGSARKTRSGKWHVLIGGLQDEAAARRVLEQFGATTIRAETGPK